MQFEDFDKKIKEAAEHHHPAYDEMAWDKMEKLLDKHLPQKEDKKRRFIFFLLLFLFLGGAGIIIGKPFRPGKQFTRAEEATGESKSSKPVQNSFEGMGAGTTDEKTVTEFDKMEDIDPIAVKKSTAVTDVDIDANSDYNNKNNILIAAKKYPAGQTRLNASVNQQKNRQSYMQYDKPIDNAAVTSVDMQLDKPANNIVKPAVTAIAKNSIIIDSADNNKEDVEIKEMSVKAGAEKIEVSDSVANKSAITIKKTQEKKKANGKAQKRNSFFLTFSAGPDISYASSGKPGKIRPVAGLGLGFTFKDRFTVRTGFYSASKVYSASPEAYHPPEVFYSYYPYLEKIDADCKVYELPITFSYSFGRSKQQHWFASAGISSYLMKTETYNYFYKTSPLGPTVSRKWGIKNENKHMFSVLGVSAGYQRNLSKSLSIIAEPYLKLPMSGVGYGKVKLNSTGLLFSIAVKPFTVAKKNKPLP
ncbi:MAG: hypothetical protein IPK57_17130 [Chitinophagaceae bacterium]|nr:hypothetical protein [Chitinophagaceae bacterium]